MLEGFLTALGIGLAVLIAAVWRDWYTRRRAERAVTTPPTAGGTWSELPPPDYVTPVITRPEPLTADEAAEIEAQQAAPETRRIDAPLCDPGLATSTHPLRAVLDEPLVLVCDDGVGSMREVLPLCEHAVRERRALLVVAPACDEDVIRTLAVNRTVGVLRAAVVRADSAGCRIVSEHSGAAPVSRAELQSGAVTPKALGSVCRSISDESWTWLVSQASSSTVA